MGQATGGCLQANLSLILGMLPAACSSPPPWGFTAWGPRPPAAPSLASFSPVPGHRHLEPVLLCKFPVPRIVTQQEVVPSSFPAQGRQACQYQVSEKLEWKTRLANGVQLGSPPSAWGLAHSESFWEPGGSRLWKAPSPHARLADSCHLWLHITGDPLAPNDLELPFSEAA